MKLFYAKASPFVRKVLVVATSSVCSTSWSCSRRPRTEQSTATPTFVRRTRSGRCRPCSSTTAPRWPTAG